MESLLIFSVPIHITVANAIFENMDVLSSMMEPLTLGTMGTQKPYRFDFETYVKEAKNKMPTRKAAGNFFFSNPYSILV